MDDRFIDFSGKYENRDVSITLKSGEHLKGYIEAVFPADEDDTGRVSFYLSTYPGHRDVYLDDVQDIKETESRQNEAVK